MIRKVIIAAIGLVVIAGAFKIFQNLSTAKNVEKPEIQQKITQVFTTTVANEDSPINIKTSGTLKAKNRMEIYAEVGGIFTSSAHSFKPGVYYAKDEILMAIDQQEELLNLKAQRSSLFNQLVLLLPDLKFDYPDAVGHWEQYVKAFDVNTELADLPHPTSEKEKLFLIGRNIYTSYYNIKNLEQQLSKFVITAPYNGILIQAAADPGTLIRSGQKLGEFISPYTYDLEVAINATSSDLLKLGSTVTLYNVDRTDSYQGKVIRINSTVDPGSQTIPVFIEVRGENLKEGMYLEADVTAKKEQNVFEIDRKLLVNDSEIYQVIDGRLALTEVQPVHFKDRTVLVRGLMEGSKILTRPVPGAHDGMIVEEITQ
jgi:membrane fusion protein, multidrug efflux system